MKWQWFRIDAWGFTLGTLFILLGIYTAYEAYMHLPLRGADFYLLVGIAMILAGLINNVVVIIYWLKRKRERKTAQTSHSKQKIYPTIICPSCGKKTSADYSQCPWCGTLLAYNEYQPR